MYMYISYSSLCSLLFQALVSKVLRKWHTQLVAMVFGYCVYPLLFNQNFYRQKMAIYKFVCPRNPWIIYSVMYYVYVLLHVHVYMYIHMCMYD